eukprot:5421850-Amphidinium_carterae.1
MPFVGGAELRVVADHRSQGLCVLHVQQSLAEFDMILNVVIVLLSGKPLALFGKKLLYTRVLTQMLALGRQCAFYFH